MKKNSLCASVLGSIGDAPFRDGSGIHNCRVRDACHSGVLHLALPLHTRRTSRAVIARAGMSGGMLPTRAVPAVMVLTRRVTSDCGDRHSGARGRHNLLDRNPQHTAKIRRALPQEARTAVHLIFNYVGGGTERTGSDFTGRSKNRKLRNAESGGQVHWTGVIGDEKPAFIYEAHELAERGHARQYDAG